ncbi:MAG: hypothetical protein ABIO88_04945 [Burkholderiaceae bacterium]
MSISQFNIVKFGLGAVVATSLLVGLSGCVVVPTSGQLVNGQTVYSAPATTYYSPPYAPYYAPYYTPWDAPWYVQTYPNYPVYPSYRAPAAQVRPVN